MPEEQKREPAARAGRARDRFGGWVGVEREATGRFRVERIHGRWVLVTPDGHGYFALGANHVGKFLSDPEDSADLRSRFGGDPDLAAAGLLSGIRGLNLTAGDAYQPDPRHRHALPYVWPVEYGGKKTVPDVFDPEAMRRFHRDVIDQVRPVADDPWVIGVAGPDLPPWDRRQLDPYREAEPAAPGREAYVRFLSERHGGDAESLHRDYGVRCGSMDELATRPRLQLEPRTPRALREDEEFLGVVADRLYDGFRRAIREAGSEHLFLGERFCLRAVPDAVLRAVGRHVDVFCTQALILSPQRPPDWQEFQPDRYAHEHRLTGKPMMIVDWAAPFSLSEPFVSEHGVIEPEPLASEQAAGWLMQAVAQPFIVGIFKCQLIGTHANDGWFHGRASRACLRHDGHAFPQRTAILRQAHAEALDRVYLDVATGGSGSRSTADPGAERPHREPSP